MESLLAWAKANDIAILPERLPVKGEWARHPNGTKKQYNPPVVIPLSTYKNERIALIKIEANERISATDWKLQRVEERKRRAKKDQADVDAVLDMRDLIRTDSDLAEIAVMALTTVEDVQAFTW